MHIGQTVTRILMRSVVILFYIERIFVSFFAGMGAMSIKKQRQQKTVILPDGNDQFG